MEKYIEKLLCVEVLEKISRFKRYLASYYSSNKSEGKEVVGLFNRALNATQENLKQIIIYLNKVPELCYLEKAYIINQISNTFETIVYLHYQLQLIYGTWVRPETYIFLNEVLNCFLPERKPQKLNIVLTNDYNFLEENLTTRFVNILNQYLILNNIKEDSPTVHLPKIDWDNPLNWVILAHECGHIDSKGINVILNDPKIIPPSIHEPHKSILKNWAEEIYCDLIASKILGPAYLASFCTFSLLISGRDDGNNEQACKSHPPNIVRISIIQEFLENMKLKVPLSKEILGCTEIDTFYFNVLEKYNELSRKYLHSSISHESLPIDLTELVDTISEHVNEFVSLNISLKTEDFNRINILKQRLANGITIASYQQLDILEQEKKLYPEDKNKVTYEDLKRAKISLLETRTKLWEILNAGWINKIETIVPKAFNLFFSEDYESDFEDKIDKFDENLLFYDKVLLKSIESSEIFKIMEEK